MVWLNDSHPIQRFKRAVLVPEGRIDNRQVREGIPSLRGQHFSLWASAGHDVGLRQPGRSSNLRGFDAGDVMPVEFLQHGYRLRQPPRERQGSPEKILHERIVGFDRAYTLKGADGLRVPPSEKLYYTDLPLHIQRQGI